MPLSQDDPAGTLQLVSSIAPVTWTTDERGQAIDIPQWCALTGQSPEQAQREGWFDAVHPDDLERVRSAWRTSVSHMSEYNTDFRVHCADGIYRWFNARGIPILDNQGKVLRWIGLLLSIAGTHRLGSSSPASPQEFDAGTLAKTMRACRSVLGWSAGELAAQAELSVSTIRRLEDGTGSVAARPANIERAFKVFEAHGISIAAIESGVQLSILST
jgi:PAS domain S-box-containing protein